MNVFRSFGLVAVVSVLVISGASTAEASHSWGGYHWARTANPFTLQLGDNVSSAWKSYLATTSSDWSASTVLDTVIKPGVTKPRTCKATLGRVEVCSEKYGYTGWLGVAQVWVNGTHITQGTVKMNDTYFASATYNKPAWRNLVMCQEVGHTFGLDHQDEVFTNTNLGTCMDYTNSPDSNQHPNAHDYEELGLIYAHFDTVTTLLQTSPLLSRAQAPQGVGADIDLSEPSAWGKAVRKDAQGRTAEYVRKFNDGSEVHTFVVWAN